ncbi:hypothetical protein EOD23_01655 [Mesorhizobium sp. USDA-HM6]|nr:hypothetical protein EOD23_01655 [Mesorhizobium sp. USDA-HM6]
MNDEFDIGHRSNNETDEDQPYEVTSFARKYGLTISAADAVLFARGPSRTACDAGALAFLCAVAAQAKKQSAR